jgi:hypothetical protein
VIAFPILIFVRNQDFSEHANDQAESPVKHRDSGFSIGFFGDAEESQDVEDTGKEEHFGWPIGINLDSLVKNRSYVVFSSGMDYSDVCGASPPILEDDSVERVAGQVKQVEARVKVSTVETSQSGKRDS